MKVALLLIVCLWLVPLALWVIVRIATIVSPSARRFVRAQLFGVDGSTALPEKSVGHVLSVAARQPRLADVTRSMPESRAMSYAALLLRRGPTRRQRDERARARRRLRADTAGRSVRL